MSSSNGTVERGAFERYILPVLVVLSLGGVASRCENLVIPDESIEEISEHNTIESELWSELHEASHLLNTPIISEGEERVAKICSSAILNDTIVITAAHCVDNLEKESGGSVQVIESSDVGTNQGLFHYEDLQYSPEYRTPSAIPTEFVVVPGKDISIGTVRPVEGKAFHSFVMPVISNEKPPIGRKFYGVSFPISNDLEPLPDEFVLVGYDEDKAYMVPDPAMDSQDTEKACTKGSSGTVAINEAGDVAVLSQYQFFKSQFFKELEINRKFNLDTIGNSDLCIFEILKQSEIDAAIAQLGETKN